MEEQQINNNKSELWNISIKDLFFKYLRFLPLFLLSAAIMLFAAYFYLRYSTEIYLVSGTAIIKNDKNSNRGDKFSELYMASGTNNIQNEIEILKSRPLMIRVINALDLQTSYYAIGKIKSSNIYKASPFHFDIFQINDSNKNFALKITFLDEQTFMLGKSKKEWKVGQVFENSNGVFRISATNIGKPVNEYEVKWQTLIQAASSLSSKITVFPKGAGTGLLTISMETPNPQLGSDIVNRLMIEYRSRSVEVKNITAYQTLVFIEERLGKLGHEVDSIEKMKLDYQKKNDLIDVSVQSASYFETLSESDKEINLLQDKLSTAGMIRGYLQEKRNVHEPFKLVPSSLGLEDVTLASLVAGYNLAQVERKSLLDGGTPPDNPVIKQKESEIEEIRARTIENLSNISNALNTTLSQVEVKSKEVQAQIKQLPEKTRNLLEINRMLEGKQTLYKFLAEKREETAITQASNIPDSDVLDTALVPTFPIKPNKRAIRLIAILIGLGIPALFIFLVEVLNDKITTRYDIEKITSAAVLGEVGHSFSNENSMVVTSTNRSMVAEQFRIIRSNLQYVLGKAEKPVILVTSSFSGEGKSFISTNLGAVMALAGKKTIVLEFDIRKPKIMSGLKLQKKAGITNFLLGKSQMSELPVLVPGHDNFFVLPCGPVPPNPSELLLEDKVAELFAYLRENFDAIIIDTAPVGMVSDAMTLSKFADCTLYIVRQGHTFKKQIILIDEFYTQARLPKISIVINDVKLKPGYGYYGYGRYGYGYGYGQGYYEEEQPPKNSLDKVIDFFSPRKLIRKITRK